MALHDPDQLAVGDMGTAAERHMLNEVRQSLLIVTLDKRSRTDQQPNRNLVQGSRVAQQGVTKTIWKLPKAYRWVRSSASIALCPDVVARQRLDSLCG